MSNPEPATDPTGPRSTARANHRSPYRKLLRLTVSGLATPAQARVLKARSERSERRRQPSVIGCGSVPDGRSTDDPTLAES